MNIVDVVGKLVGEIMPIGETYEDEKRFENLKEICALVNVLISKIDNVAFSNRSRQEYSMKRAGEYADKFLTNTIGIVE